MRTRRQARPPAERGSTLHGTLLLITAILGLTALAGAVFGYFSAADLRARHAEVATLPDLLSAPRGERGLLEGRVALGVQPLRSGFVAFVREEYRRRGWESIEQAVQPMMLDTRRGPARIVNADYRLDRTIDEWHHVSGPESEPGWVSGAIRMGGLVTGRTVLVVGRLTPSGSNLEVSAEWVAGVTREAYLAELTRDIGIAMNVNHVFLAVGVIGVVSGVLFVRRFVLE